ncbi:nitroreductase [Labilibaculum filiforme]|uniref:Nitroreductase n=1 Tax=Labilibaculum filiforme TaxID=1940526 RepID=A0A2N3I216_9BACT|nr:nitroreductase family protein [Labilibaculum filiforme]PKQ64364.1 nitroreductase [Labilibaculum filiforme]
MSHKIHELVDKRWSPRAFSNKEIEPEKVQSLFEAASFAASCFNEQPWRFIYAVKEYPERYEQLLSCLVEFNKMWVKTAPMIILTLASKKFAQNQKENWHARHDLGLAIGNMSAQATGMGLYLHQMAGFHVEKAREMFEIPDQFDVVTMIAVGYLGDPAQLPDNIREMESGKRLRRPLNTILFDGDWEEMK